MHSLTFTEVCMTQPCQVITAAHPVIACVQVCASRLQGMELGAQGLAHSKLDPGVG